MLNGLLIFLVGALVLLVVLYIFSLIFTRAKLPDDIQNIALAIIALIGIILILSASFFSGVVIVGPVR